MDQLSLQIPNQTLQFIMFTLSRSQGMHFTIGTCNCKLNIKVAFFKLLWYILALRFSSRVLEHISVIIIPPC